MENVVFWTIVVFIGIWTVMIIFVVRAVFQIVSWIEDQKLVGEVRNYYGTASEAPHKAVAGHRTHVHDPDEEMALQEEVALKTAQNRDIEYEGVEASLVTLGEEVKYADGDNSLDIVEKLRKLQDDK